MTGLVEAAARLADDGIHLALLLDAWAHRDDSTSSDPAAGNRAGHQAVALIDAMTRELHGIHAGLVSAI